MKYPIQFFISLLIATVTFSGCGKDEDPIPKPESYLEYSGKVYELKTGYYDEEGTNAEGDQQFSVAFYTHDAAELAAIGKEEAFFKGSFIFLNLISKAGLRPEEGIYTFSSSASMEELERFNISDASAYIEFDMEKGAGIVIAPLSGTFKLEKRENGDLVTFEFELTNGEKLLGRFQGDLIKREI